MNYEAILKEFKEWLVDRKYGYALENLQKIIDQHTPKKLVLKDPLGQYCALFETDSGMLWLAIGEIPEYPPERSSIALSRETASALGSILCTWAIPGGPDWNSIIKQKKSQETSMFKVMNKDDEEDENEESW